ncbi:hypothetical protein CEN50_18495 [Fischerella thermalis CCMEE 5268]|uniref:Uncharacterized protein n=1 Tax=Fischerella thermalis CCMEE 5268 TaxID=2019662 RepID=A0A2N6KCP8_9CYAN|nr:hypothetical protein [Fischerella thermalis]PLZ96485.1 hypothetical protein CEN50_18495 [Fischerella thermalis CCMEE 5268]
MSSLYSDDTLQYKDKVNNMVLAVSSAMELFPESFRKESIKLWGTEYVSWKTATTYDATQVILEGLRKIQVEPNREALYNELSAPDFSVEGATGTVRFDAKHDRVPEKNKIGVLVQVKQKCKPEDQPRYRFCLIQE